MEIISFFNDNIKLIIKFLPTKFNYSTDILITPSGGQYTNHLSNESVCMCFCQKRRDIKARQNFL